jgi:hypothetical protein
MLTRERSEDGAMPVVCYECESFVGSRAGKEPFGALRLTMDAEIATDQLPSLACHLKTAS